MSILLDPKCYELLYRTPVLNPQYVFTNISSVFYVDFHSMFSITDHGLWDPTSETVVRLTMQHSAPGISASGCFYDANGVPLSKTNGCKNYTYTVNLAQNGLNIFPKWLFSHSFTQPVYCTNPWPLSARMDLFSRKQGWDLTSNATTLRIPPICIATSGVNVSATDLLPVAPFDQSDLANRVARSLVISSNITVSVQVSASSLAPLNTTIELLYCVTEKFSHHARAECNLTIH